MLNGCDFMQYLIEPCASSKAYEVKFGHSIDLEKLSNAMEENNVFSLSSVVLLAKINGKPVSIYSSGRAMIKEVKKEEAEQIAKVLFLLLS